MIGHLVHLLDVGCVVGWRGDQDVGQWGALSAAEAGEGDRLHVELARLGKAGDDIGGVAGGGQCDRCPAGRAGRLHLAGEDHVEVVIVAQAGEDRRVGGQRLDAQGAPLGQEPSDQLAGDVLCVGG